MQRIVRTDETQWPTAAGRPAPLSSILKLGGRGMSRVDPIILRLLMTFEQGTVDFDQEIDDSDFSDPVRDLNVAGEDGAADPPGAGGATNLTTEKPALGLKQSSVARILVTDDSDDVRLALQTLLEDAGHEVMEATDGVEAVKLAQSDTPDLILLDVMMPNMDGFTALKHLKSDPATKNIPVIMVTARGGRNDQENARGLGAFDYIHKPWSDGEVEMTVKWALSRP